MLSRDSHNLDRHAHLVLFGNGIVFVQPGFALNQVTVNDILPGSLCVASESPIGNATRFILYKLNVMEFAFIGAPLALRIVGIRALVGQFDMNVRHTWPLP